MIRFCWIVTMLGACAGMLAVIDIFMTHGASAVQQGASAAIACALCIVPYVFTRSIEGLNRGGGPSPPDRPFREELVDPRELLSRDR